MRKLGHSKKKPPSLFPPTTHPQKKKGCVTHYGLAIYILKSINYILRQKKNYANSNISPCKNIIFIKKKIPLKEAKIPQDIYILTL
jgi:hypothetical protein